MSNIINIGDIVELIRSKSKRKEILNDIDNKWWPELIGEKGIVIERNVLSSVETKVKAEERKINNKKNKEYEYQIQLFKMIRGLNLNCQVKTKSKYKDLKKIS